MTKRLEELFATKVPATYVADGHHRTAAAARIGKEKEAQNPGKTVLVSAGERAGEEDEHFGLIDLVEKAHQEWEPASRRSGRARRAIRRHCRDCSPDCPARRTLASGRSSATRSRACGRPMCRSCPKGLRPRSSPMTWPTFLRSCGSLLSPSGLEGTHLSSAWLRLPHLALSASAAGVGCSTCGQ